MLLCGVLQRNPGGSFRVRQCPSSGNRKFRVVHALQEVRLLKHGDLLAAAVNGQIEGVSRLHAEYLKEMAELGVPSRRSDLPVRVEAHNHGSVHGYEEELLSKAWKDAAYGAVLLVDPSRSGVAEIPLGWPKARSGGFRSKTRIGRYRPRAGPLMICVFKIQRVRSSITPRPHNQGIRVWQGSHCGGMLVIQVYCKGAPRGTFHEHSNGTSFGRQMFQSSQ